MSPRAPVAYLSADLAGARGAPVPVGSPALLAAREGGADLQTRATPAAAFRAARRMFLRCQRVDMRALARELGVSRGTLYRWTGDRDQLLSDVLWSLSDNVFEQAKLATSEFQGRERLLAIFRHHLQTLTDARPLSHFLQQETHAALRILTARDGGVHSRTVQKLAALYGEEQQAGHFEPSVPVDTLAYAVVRVTEGFIYNDAVARMEPELERAIAIVSLLLR